MNLAFFFTFLNNNGLKFAGVDNNFVGYKPVNGYLTFLFESTAEFLNGIFSGIDGVIISKAEQFRI